MEFSKTLRLESVWQELLRAGSQMNVTRIPMIWDSAVLERFASDYRELLLELPWKTILKQKKSWFYKSLISSMLPRIKAHQKKIDLIHCALWIVMSRADKLC